MQLVAVGPQDVYLTGNPQITFFKVMYRRYTNFSTEIIQQNFEGTPNFGRTVNCIISKNGDLVTKIYVKVILKATESKSDVKFGYVNKLGFAMLKSSKVELGGTKIDEQYGDWLNIWMELTVPQEKQSSYLNLIGQREELTRIETYKEESIIYIPLQFWFCRFNGLAIPLIALQYHDLKISVTFSDVSDCINIATGKNRSDIMIKDSYLLVEYVYLDGKERKRFATMPHEYLIEQLQYSEEELLKSNVINLKLNFSHPCKYIIWLLNRGAFVNNYNTIAINDSGKVNKNHFGKILWLLTRDGTYIYQNNHYYLQVNEDEDVNSPPNSIGLTPQIIDILTRIEAEFLFTNNDNTIDLENLENIYITQSLNNKDISTLFEDINASLSSDVQKNLLKYYGISFIQQFNYSMFIDNKENPVTNGHLLLNGHSRFSEKTGNYFNYVQPYQHFTRTPSDGINIYSFALNPQEHQPSGSCNMSKIDNAILSLNFNFESDQTNNPEWSDTNLKVFACNYNILRIMGGMGGLAYLN